MTTIETPATLHCQTRYFGTLEYHDDAVLEFPAGLPAFEHERRFLAVQQPFNAPLVFLQSLADPKLCFVTLPVQAICAGYGLSIAPEDLEILGLPDGQQPVIGRDVLCLAILSFVENALPTANLLAPVVVNLQTRIARQTIQTDTRYSHRERLPWREAVCS